MKLSTKVTMMHELILVVQMALRECYADLLNSSQPPMLE